MVMRARETRAMSARITAQDYSPPSALMLPEAKPGYHLRLVREIGVDGQVDKNNLMKRAQEGYVPVKASDYPEAALGESGDAAIRRGKHILMQIPIERVEARQRYYQNLSRGQVETVDRQQGFRPAGGFVPTREDGVAEVTQGGRRVVGAPE